MVLTYPAGHKTRYENFELKGFLDETLRVGAERLFTVDDTEKFNITNKLVEAGIQDIIIGSGPQDHKCLEKKFNDTNAVQSVKYAFIFLLNSWEPIYEQFKQFPKLYLEDICISFGMVEYGQNEQLLEKVHQKFKEIGVKHFRVSLINNFANGVDEEKYEQISKQDIIEISNNLSIAGSIS